MANETLMSGNAAVIPTDEVATYVRMYPRARPAGLGLAWVEGATLGVAKKFPRLNTAAVQPAGTHTEGAAFTRVANATAAVSITPALVGSSLKLTDEMRMSAGVQGFAESLIIDRINALTTRMDSDLLSGISGATLTSGDDTTDLSRDGLVAAIAVAHANNLSAVGQGLAIILSNAAAEDYLTELVTSAATYVQSELAASFSGGVFLDSFLTLPVLRGANMPANGAGYSSAIVPMGMGGGLCLALAEGINARPVQREEEDASDVFVVRSGYAASADDAAVVEYITA